MRARALQKITLSGNTSRLTLPRHLLHALGLVPGDFVLIEQTGEGVAEFRRWSPDDTLARKSPGMLPPPMPELAR